MSEINRLSNRQIFYDIWAKFNAHETLEPDEKKIIDVIINHPEYQYIFENAEKYLDKNFRPEQEEANPFVHFSLHMALNDFLRNDEPKGILKMYQKIRRITGSPHQTDHYFMELIAYEMHEAFTEQRAMNVKAILTGAKKLLRKL